jgi:hypothetical protein
MKHTVMRVKTNSTDGALAAGRDMPEIVGCKIIAVKRHYGRKKCSVLLIFDVHNAPLCCGRSSSLPVCLPRRRSR